ncbi:MAG: LptF/LptG family permease [Spirochaetaceae bacterium]|jgi:lipopolysaccharide export system permease protein|nr:LptF/LptG family permease [Spirochaetaceae bacterium]
MAHDDISSKLDSLRIDIRRLQKNVARMREENRQKAYFMSFLPPPRPPARTAVSARPVIPRHPSAPSSSRFDEKAQVLQKTRMVTQKAQIALETARQLQAALEAERAAQAEKLERMQKTLDVERAAKTARVGELQKALEAERHSLSEEIRQLQDNLDAEQAAQAEKLQQYQTALEEEQSRHLREAEQTRDALLEAKDAVSLAKQAVLDAQRAVRQAAALSVEPPEEIRPPLEKIWQSGEPTGGDGITMSSPEESPGGRQAPAGEAPVEMRAVSPDEPIPAVITESLPAEKKTPSGPRPTSNRLPRNVLVNYLVRELMLYFLMAVLFFFLVFFVNQILLMAQDILKYHVPLSDVARLILYSLPFSIAQAAPFATIVGFLMCLGRLMTDNEILIFRASGRSYSLLLCIVLVLGLGISGASFLVNDYLLPLGISSYNQLYRRVSVANPAVVLESNSVKRTNDLTVVVGNVTEQAVSDMVFFDLDADRNQRIIVSGQSTVHTPSDKSVLMQINMSDVTVVSLDRGKKSDYDVITSENVNMNLFASTIFQVNPVRAPNEYPFLELREQLREMRAKTSANRNTINIYSLELNKKFSLPLGAIFFAFLALPLAIMFGKQNGQTIGLIIGLLLSFVYWAMIIVGQRMAIRNGINSTVVMWLPDAVMGAAGMVFFIGLRRR